MECDYLTSPASSWMNHHPGGIIYDTRALGWYPEFPSLSPIGHSRKSHWPTMCTECAHDWPTRFEG